MCAPSYATVLGVAIVVGYARVSTNHQQLLAQTDVLTGAGCERIFTDQMSGVREDRPGLLALLDPVRAGDTVMVVALDRLGRSLSGVIRTIETLTERGVLLRSLREGVDYSTATGRMLAGIFAALAGYERELMLQRAAAAREAARLRGRHTGGPPKHQRARQHLRGVSGDGVPGPDRPGRPTRWQRRLGARGAPATHAPRYAAREAPSRTMDRSDQDSPPEGRPRWRLGQSHPSWGGGAGTSR